MDEEIISRWNAVVKPNDRIYVLGDVVINRRFLHKIGRLAGKKTLVKGNHDIFDIQEYLLYFEEVHGAMVYDDYIATHIPIHTESLSRFKANVHGHLHANRVLLKPNRPKIDPRYYCVSVEHTNFAPLHHDELKKLIQEQQP